MRLCAATLAVALLAFACKMKSFESTLKDDEIAALESDPGFALWGFRHELQALVSEDYSSTPDTEEHPGEDDLLDEALSLLDDSLLDDALAEQQNDPAAPSTTEGETETEREPDEPGAEYAGVDDPALENGFQPLLAEGDMVVDEDAGAASGEAGLALANRTTGYLWPGGRVYYAFASGISSSQRKMVTDAMREWTQKTGVQFSESSTQAGHVLITARKKGCYATVGYTGMRQTLNLGEGCFHHGVILHELGHTLGLHHEQARSDASEYITFKMENVQDDAKDQFSRAGTPVGAYDYDSIMHYSQTTFSRNGKATMIPKKAGVQIGRLVSISSGDAAAIQRLYGTSGSGGSSGGSTVGTNCAGAYGFRWAPKSARNASGQCRDARSFCSCWTTKAGKCNVYTSDKAGKARALGTAVSKDSGNCYKACDQLVKSASSAVHGQCNSQLLMVSPDRKLEVWRYKR